MKALARRYRTEVLLVVATLVLFLFYYVARPDAIGTRGQARDFFTVTFPALSPTLHFVASALLLGERPVSTVAAELWTPALVRGSPSFSRSAFARGCNSPAASAGRTSG